MSRTSCWRNGSGPGVWLRRQAVNRRVAAVLRRVADRIDHRGAPKLTHWSFTFERGLGLVFNEQHRGCPVAYLGDDDYERAHGEVRSPV